MPDRHLHAPLAGMLLSLFALGGCGQPPAGSDDTQQRREPPVQQEASAAAAPEAPPPAATVPEKPVTAVEPPGKKPTLESLVLTPEDTPFAGSAPHGFGEVRGADWLTASPSRSATNGLLPDLFEHAANQGRLNVEGELLLDGSQETTRMLDGVGMKLKISTD